MASKGILPAVQFARALEAAGVVSDLDTITRIVIDVDPRNVVQVYVQRVAGPELKQVAGLLGEMMRGGRAENPDAPRGVRYWTDLPAEGDFTMRALSACGVRIIEQGPRTGPRTEMYLVEDPGAPAGLSGRTVSLVFEEADGKVRIIQRDVIA